VGNCFPPASIADALLLPTLLPASLRRTPGISYRLSLALWCLVSPSNQDILIQRRCFRRSVLQCFKTPGSSKMQRPQSMDLETSTPEAVPESQTNGQIDTSAASDMSSYTFPQHRLKRLMSDSSKTPLLLVACGSFSPITYLHLRMFEMAADYVRFNTEFEIIGGYLSPVSDAYKKAGLASAEHR